MSAWTSVNGVIDLDLYEYDFKTRKDLDELKIKIFGETYYTNPETFEIEGNPDCENLVPSGSEDSIQINNDTYDNVFLITGELRDFEDEKVNEIYEWMRNIPYKLEKHSINSGVIEVYSPNYHYIFYYKQCSTGYPDVITIKEPK